jgi:hypothetical protein
VAAHHGSKNTQPISSGIAERFLKIHPLISAPRNNWEKNQLTVFLFSKILVQSMFKTTSFMMNLGENCEEKHF